MEEAAVEAHEGQEGRFHDFKAPISSVNKTGLGSSAALVTALTSAVLQFCYAKAPPKMLSSGHRYQDHLHRLAQLAHCAAQGKVSAKAAAHLVSSPQRFEPICLLAIPN